MFQFPSSCLKLEDYIKHSNEGVGTLHCKYIEPKVFVMHHIGEHGYCTKNSLLI
jgi:hypothetical protein